MKKFFLIFSLLVTTGALVMSQTVQIVGTVSSSEDGLALPGVNVTVKGTTVGTITGSDGKYVITAPVSGQTLTFSFIGYKSLDVPINGKSKIDVLLEQDLFNVDEVVVIAYGTQSKRDITGSVASVKGEELKAVPVQSFDQALQGKAAGVSITMPNGVLNNPPVIRIRGINSISASSYPLIVVDGVPVFTGDVSNSNAYANALADINPSDIQSMDILKDASATALYGSRASNGVILITTKRGYGSKTKVTYDGYAGYTKAYNLFDMMNASQYIEHKNRAWVNRSGASAGVFTDPLDANGNPIDTKWSDYVYRTGFQQSHALTISGSTPSTSYFLSIGYTDQAGMIRTNNYTRKNARLNIEHKLNKFINLGANIAYTNGFSKAPDTGSSFSTGGAARLAFVLAPNLAPYNNDGTYNLASGAIGNMGQPIANYGYYNPVALFDLNKFTAETDRILATISASVTPFKGLVFKTVYGIDNLASESQSYLSPIAGDGYSTNGQATNYFNRFNRWTWTNTLNYDLILKEKYNFGFLAGTEEQRTVNNYWFGDKSNVSDPFFKTYQGSWITSLMGGGSMGENYFVSYFGRLSFNYNKKYYIEGSVRRDGFSGLAKGNKFGNFGGASVMWNISNEEFIANSSVASLFSDIRLKASYGKVGNMSGVDNFSSLFLYSAGVYGDAATLNFSQAGNADLKWETSNKYDVGLSFGLLKDKFQVELNYFYNDVNGLILDVPQSPSKGIPDNTVPANVGSMFNKGFEFTLTSYNISKPDFSWTTTFNLSTLKNEVTALAEGVNEIVGYTATLERTSSTRVGYPIGNIFTVTTNGVDPESGRRIFVDAAGREVLFSFETADRWHYRDDGTVAPAISTAADGKIQGSPLPKFYGGLDNTLSYKNFDFSLNLTYAFDFKLYCGTQSGLRDQRWWNNSVEVYETAWRNPGDVTNIPLPVYGDNISNGSSFPISENVVRGDYVKVRNISLGYTFRKLPQITNIQSVRLYTQVFNAFVFTKYPGSDPEVSTNGNNNLTPGVDRNTAPQARTVTFGLSVNF